MSKKLVRSTFRSLFQLESPKMVGEYILGWRSVTIIYRSV